MSRVTPSPAPIGTMTTAREMFCPKSVTSSVMRSTEWYACPTRRRFGRILGSSAFVEAVRQEVQPAGPPPGPRLPLPELVARLCHAAGIPPEALQQGSRRAAVARTRAGIAYLAVERYGYSGVSLRPLLGVGAPSIHKAAQRGRADAKRWERLLEASQRGTKK